MPEKNLTWVDYRIEQIAPAAPGWKAVCSDDSPAKSPIQEDVACWAVVARWDMKSVDGHSVSLGILDRIVSGLVSSELGMYVPEQGANFIGYLAPGETKLPWMSLEDWNNGGLSATRGPPRRGEDDGKGALGRCEAVEGASPAQGSARAPTE